MSTRPRHVSLGLWPRKETCAITKHDHASFQIGCEDKTLAAPFFEHRTFVLRNEESWADKDPRAPDGNRPRIFPNVDSEPRPEASKQHKTKATNALQTPPQLQRLLRSKSKRGSVRDDRHPIPGTCRSHRDRNLAGRGGSDLGRRPEAYRSRTNRTSEPDGRGE